MLTGHSLGAGAAALIALKLRSRFPGAAASPAWCLGARVAAQRLPRACMHARAGLRGCWGLVGGCRCAPSARPGHDRLGVTSRGGLTGRGGARADLRCWSFCPPGGLVSKALQPALEGWCTSLVAGKDAVPRSSTNNLRRLMDEMITALARCRCAAGAPANRAGRARARVVAAARRPGRRPGARPRAR